MPLWIALAVTALFSKIREKASFRRKLPSPAAGSKRTRTRLFSDIPGVVPAHAELSGNSAGIANCGEQAENGMSRVFRLKWKTAILTSPWIQK